MLLALTARHSSSHWVTISKVNSVTEVCQKFCNVVLQYNVQYNTKIYNAHMWSSIKHESEVWFRHFKYAAVKCSSILHMNYITSFKHFGCGK